jgi:FdhD protein
VSVPDASPASGDAAAVRQQVRVARWIDGKTEHASDQVAEEAPVALRYNGIPHVIMLATPADLEDLARGFTLTEGIVSAVEEIRSVEVRRERGGHEVAIRIPNERMASLLNRVRNLTGRTGCGLCGAETIEQAIRVPAPVETGMRITVSELHATLATLQDKQPLNARTGSVHAAAWALPQGGIRLVREDVGRHNALDKVVGALSARSTDPGAGYLIITSRASYEMVQKAATVGIALIVAVSAPTALAIRLAEHAGVTLIGFARSRQHVVYTHSHRLLEQ